MISSHLNSGPTIWMWLSRLDSVYPNLLFLQFWWLCANISFSLLFSGLLLQGLICCTFRDGLLHTLVVMSYLNSCYLLITFRNLTILFCPLASKRHFLPENCCSLMFSLFQTILCKEMIPGNQLKRAHLPPTTMPFFSILTLGNQNFSRSSSMSAQSVYYIRYWCKKASCKESESVKFDLDADRIWGRIWMKENKTQRRTLFFLQNHLSHNLFHQVLRHPEEMLQVVCSNAGSF